MGTGAVIKPLVMLAEEIDTVVTAVWRANKGVDVITRGHDIVEGNARMMIELDQHDGTMDPVVEGTIIGYRAHPGKVGLIEILIDFAHLHPGVAFGGPTNVGGDHGPQAAALRIGQVGGADSSEGNNGVVPERASLHPAIEGVLQLSGKVVGMDRGSQDGAGYLLVIERADQFQAGRSSAQKTIVPASGPSNTWHGSEPMKLGASTS